MNPVGYITSLTRTAQSELDVNNSGSTISYYQPQIKSRRKHSSLSI